MDVYPADYVEHNLPFIVLSGLGNVKELQPPPPVQDVLPGSAVTIINTEIPVVESDRGYELLQEFLSADGMETPWNGRRISRRGVKHGFRIRSIGRKFQFPPRKADAPSTSPTSPQSSPTITAATSWVLHSPISPLTPGSLIFPDGVIASSWVAKHQHYIPSAFISFFDFITDPITNSLHDNQLKTEIVKIKGQIQKSDYRTRYVVVLLSNKSVLEVPDIEERLAIIRRATGLDPKNSFFFLPPNTSQVELRAFVTSVLSTLQPICVEYYRDLTKHARRKKGRGTIPPPTARPTRGTSQPLPFPGWAVRYDFKLGVFAEFRQEMDAAQRHYNFALDTLFSPEGLFETTASWSPRWDEIRLLADIIAFRYVRCQLWNDNTTSTVQTWFRYKIRLRDVLDRRGKGTGNYGWQAWEARWCQMMAQIIQRVDLPIFAVNKAQPDPLSQHLVAFYALPEKQFPVGEKLPPWEQLHHAGYWYKLSADYAKRRYLLARGMPEEDRTPPDMSPATKVSNRNQVYDYYLVPEPHEEYPVMKNIAQFEHWKDITSKTDAAISAFRAHGQHRKVNQLQLENAKTYLHAKKFDEAFKVLQPLWETMAWRKEGWWSLTAEVLWALHECALHVRDREAYVATEWELHSQIIPGKTRYKYNLMTCLEALPRNSAAEKVSVKFEAADRVSCLHVTFAFSDGESSVGEPLHAQIVMVSNARQGSAPITLSLISYRFNGALSEVCLSHITESGALETESRIRVCTMEEHISVGEKPRWSGQSDLTVYPGQTKVYDFVLTFREAGDINATAFKYEVNTESFYLTCANNNLEELVPPKWWIQPNIGIKSRKLKRGSGISIHILPKPPKMEILLSDVKPQYYTDEPVTLIIEVLNQEEEDTEAVLEVRILGRTRDILQFSWVDRPAPSPMKEVPPRSDGSTDVNLPGHVIGKLVQGAKTTERIQFTAPSDPADYVLEVKVIYHLLSDRETPVSKILVADLVFNAPFEASYDLNARIHTDPWPSYFALQDAESNHPPESTDAFGIAQKWGLRAKVASFADEQLIIKDLIVEVHGIHGGATCDVLKEFSFTDFAMDAHILHDWSFSLDVRKNNLEERRATALDTTLNITWQRTSLPDGPTVTSSLPIPRIQIPSAEPRVLVSATPSTSIASLIHLDYVLENPTMHFLTFELNMEASEEFGFSGAKLRTLHILPMSRQTERYNVLPRVKGAWIMPNLKVMDSYFNKNLKVQATESLRSDKKGVGVWVAGDGEGDGKQSE